MENENLQQVKTDTAPRSIRDVLFILRKNIALMLAVFFAVLVVGGVATFMVKSGYTSKEMVMLNIKNEQTTGSQNNTKPNVNTMSAWRHTIMDFASQGVVLDRANYYYEQFKASSVKEVDEFIETQISVLSDSYNPKTNKAKGYYYASSKISIGGFNEEKDEPEGFSFSINYSDGSYKGAYEKIRLLARAFADEAGLEKDGVNTYFGGMHVTIYGLGNMGTTSNKNVMTSMVIAVLIGVVLALVSVYLKTVLDNTVKAKDELEKITGASVLSAIENKE